MTDALRTDGGLPRPPESGPGSDKETWRAYVAEKTGRAIEGDLEKISTRDELIAIVDHMPPPEDVRPAPEGVEVLEAEEDEHGRERPPAMEGNNGGPAWVVPVEGGYVAEDDLVRADRERQAEEKKRRHAEAIAQLRPRDAGV